VRESTQPLPASIGCSRCSLAARTSPLDRRLRLANALLPSCCGGVVAGRSSAPAGTTTTSGTAPSLPSYSSAVIRLSFPCLFGFALVLFRFLADARAFLWFLARASAWTPCDVKAPTPSSKSSSNLTAAARRHGEFLFSWIPCALRFLTLPCGGGGVLVCDVCDAVWRSSGFFGHGDDRARRSVLPAVVAVRELGPLWHRRHQPAHRDGIH
jgi:hypothetical protein